MELEEVDDIVEARIHQLVEATGRGIDRAVVRKQLGDHAHSRLDQDQTGRFERLQESR